jgi:hypothetical protein
MRAATRRHVEAGFSPAQVTTAHKCGAEAPPQLYRERARQASCLPGSFVLSMRL